MHPFLDDDDEQDLLPCPSASPALAQHGCMPDAKKRIFGHYAHTDAVWVMPPPALLFITTNQAWLRACVRSSHPFFWLGKVESAWARMNQGIGRKEGVFLFLACSGSCDDADHSFVEIAGFSFVLNGSCFGQDETPVVPCSPARAYWPLVSAKDFLEKALAAASVYRMTYVTISSNFCLTVVYYADLM